MKCNMKTIMKIGACIGVLLAVAYAALPLPIIAGASPLLFALLCPLSMLLMMKGMHSDREPVSAPTQTPHVSQRGEGNAE